VTKSFMLGLLASCLLVAEPALALSVQDQQSGQSQGQAGRSSRARPAQRPAPARQPTPEENMAAAQAAATAANLGCQVAQARYLGEDAAKTKGYEIQCSEGPGYIVLASTPPQSFNCLELANSAVNRRRTEGEAADVGSQCQFPENLDVVRAVKPTAAQAGVSCDIDQARILGLKPEGGLIWEVGCKESEGFWVEQTDGAWVSKPCLLSATNQKCEFTTVAEQASTWRPKLVGSAAAACDLQEIRFLGRNPNGDYYELRCGSADGWLVRVVNNAVTAGWECASAQAKAIGGGCRMTTAAPAASGGHA